MGRNANPDEDEDEEEEIPFEELIWLIKTLKD